MESPLSSSNTLFNSSPAGKQQKPMDGSLSSTPVEDTSPSDSGVQMLDSEISEIMGDSITSANFDEEDVNGKPAFINEQHCNMLAAAAAAAAVVIEEPLAAAVIVDNNSNAIADQSANDESLMNTSTCSTFDTTESIVYRRKVRKNAPAAKAPKKRVSFHEDILKNTRTDNIHIEHGFITYKSARKYGNPNVGGMPGRYSWCSEGNDKAGHGPTELCARDDDDDENDENASGNNAAHGRSRRGVVYRNACSDVLDYGNSDIYDTNESTGLQYDNSGVFEYVSKEEFSDGTVKQADVQAEDKNLYRCSCSSNSSLDSDGSDKNSNPKQYQQAKSSSCDCIGMSNANNNFIDENCYFSEPNIENLNERPVQKSVWNKEKKPKSSCLKKTKRHTDIIVEQDLSTKVKKFNVHVDVNQLLDNSSKMLIGSLKSIFTMPMPERGVPEGSEDLQAVSECIPEQTPEHKAPEPPNKLLLQLNDSPPPLKVKPFLSKSLDGSKQTGNAKKFVHNVDEQLRRNNEQDLTAPTRQSSAEKQCSDNNKLQQQQHHAQLQRQQEFETETECESVEMEAEQYTPSQQKPQQFRNKFIINCESTVFEHTGVSYETQLPFNLPGVSPHVNDIDNEGDASEHSECSSSNLASQLHGNTPIAQAESDNLRSAFSAAPLAKTFSNFFRSFKDSEQKKLQKQKQAAERQRQMQQQQQATESYFAMKMNKPTLPAQSPLKSFAKMQPTATLNSVSSPTSTISDFTNGSNSSASTSQQQPSSSGNKFGSSCSNSNSLAIAQELQKQSRHLASPLKKRNMSQQLPPRFGGVGSSTLNLEQQAQPHVTMLSSEAAISNYLANRGGGSGRDSKSTILSEEFDDILTITTDITTNDRNDSDMVFVDYSELSDRSNLEYVSNNLKPPQPPAAKTSLINRFLRNVTQKKLMESSMRSNNFFASKLKKEQKLFANHLYVPGVKPKNHELIDDLNAEIAMEIEMSAAINSPRRELAALEASAGMALDDDDEDVDLSADISRFELGIGEIAIEIFQGKRLHFLQNDNEQLMKVFKLYTGYSREGFMTPVLVFLSNRCLYVTDLLRNRLCCKFVLAYEDLDVILMGPFGNTVLLSNSLRDMQQVLLAGGPYPADALVANLELCARRNGSILPSVGQLTFDHLAPLQTFVRENSCVSKEDKWMFYAVVNVPAAGLGNEQAPLGPHVKGFLMHRRIKQNCSQSAAGKYAWNPGYFLLKAGVLYMFNDSSQKLPSWAMALAECQGARRAMKAGRPHCFEILLKKQLLQLAAPDEYVASEWLQALLQSASGLFEMQEKHKTFGCTLVVTQNHLITLREDFCAPLRQLNQAQQQEQHISSCKQLATSYANIPAAQQPHLANSYMAAIPSTPPLNLLPLRRQSMLIHDDNSIYSNNSTTVLSSNLSTPTHGHNLSYSSINSTPTKLSQLSRSTAAGAGNNTITSNSTSASISAHSKTAALAIAAADNAQGTPSKQNNYSRMSSVYGKNAGLEILTCADIKEMTAVKISSHNDTWWCILEFSCQEVRESTDDLVIFFASSSEMQRFLRLLEQLWQAKNNDLFPITVLDEDDATAEQCTMLYVDINRSWQPLLSAALGYPLNSLN